MAKILDGASLAREIRGEVALGVTDLAARTGTAPGLAAVLVGEDPASAVYVRNKGQACGEVGMFSETFHLPGTTTQDELLELVKRLNTDERFHGILMQLPLPAQISEEAVIEAVSPAKDVDGIHPFNLGKLLQGSPVFVPGTPAGIQQILVRNGYDPAGQQVVVCGRSNIVGKPLAALLMQRAGGANATVTVCHTRTRDLAEITRQADILVAAVGSPRAVTADMVRNGAVVIDVGINRIDDASRRRGYRLVGDVDFDGMESKVEAITPVPGGVGPMTIAMLLVNTLKAAELASSASF